LFTNVAVTPDGSPYWEGMDGPAPVEAQDWQGRPWTPASETKAAHPNSRFTTSARQCPVMSPEWESPQGVPISAILFGGRRANLVPLVFQSLNWQHGVFLGSTMASETTAAATGKVGIIRRDPMAMLPFCGYNMGDYFDHWMKMGTRMANPPKIFRVNWFRMSENNEYLWPGFGENLRALRWVLSRVHGEVDARETEIGYLPYAKDIDTSDLDVTPETMEGLLSVNREGWKKAIEGQKEFFTKFGDRMPQAMWQEHEDLKRRLGA